MSKVILKITNILLPVLSNFVLKIGYSLHGILYDARHSEVIILLLAL